MHGMKPKATDTAGRTSSFALCCGGSGGGAGATAAAWVTSLAITFGIDMPWARLTWVLPMSGLIHLVALGIVGVSTMGRGRLASIGFLTGITGLLVTAGGTCKIGPADGMVCKGG